MRSTVEAQPALCLLMLKLESRAHQEGTSLWAGLLCVPQLSVCVQGGLSGTCSIKHSFIERSCWHNWHSLKHRTIHPKVLLSWAWRCCAVCMMHHVCLYLVPATPLWAMVPPWQQQRRQRGALAWSCRVTNPGTGGWLPSPSPGLAGSSVHTWHTFTPARPAERKRGDAQQCSNPLLNLQSGS